MSDFTKYQTFQSLITHNSKFSAGGFPPASRFCKSGIFVITLGKIENVMTQKPKYPIGDQSFSSLIEEGYLYVDKTRFIEK